MHFERMTTSNSSNCTSVMLRNHFVVSVDIESAFQFVIGLYYALFIAVESCLFAVLLGIHFKIREGCHPFFSSLFGCVLFCYIVCGYTESVCQCLFLFRVSDEASSVVFTLYDLIYSAITALCFCCLIERTIATIWAVSYETSRNWLLFLLSVSLSVSSYVYFSSFLCRGCFVSAIVTAVIIIGCVCLYFLNRKWTLCYQTDVGFMSKVTLSMRYQIIENMIVVRKALLPVIVLDSMVTLVDFASIELTTMMVREEEGTCHSLIEYLPYIVCNHLAMILEYTIPLYLLLTRKSYRKQLPRRFRFCHSSARIHQSRDSIIANVFGRELNVVRTQNEYFENLQNEWK